MEQIANVTYNPHGTTSAIIIQLDVKSGSDHNVIYGM